MELRKTIWGALLRAARWLAQRKLELALLAFGIVLRASMAWTYKAEWSYDAKEHWALVQWIFKYRTVPPVEATFHAFHPPLYYSSAALLFGLGVSRESLVWYSIATGVARLGLLWAGLELYLPHSRTARLAALALAAVLAASVHIDGMIYPEALSGLWLTLAMLLVPLVFRRPPKTRWKLAGVLGIVFGLAMLTKVSAFAVLVAIGLGAFLEFFFSGRDLRTRAKDLLAWAGMLGVCLALSGWFYYRNVRDYGKPFVTSFDLKSQHALVAEAEKLPYLERRSLDFVFGWNDAVRVWPYFPAAIKPHPQFFPVAIASTFVDYWNFSFSGIDPAKKGSRIGVIGARPLSEKVLKASQYAVLGGMVIFASVAVAWIIAARRTFARKDFGMVALLLVPLVTLGSAIHFAIQCPVDHYGVVKGVYMHFGAPPLYALFGLAVAWAQRKPTRWLVFVALCAALWLVATYTTYCRLRLPLMPLG